MPESVVKAMNSLPVRWGTNRLTGMMSDLRGMYENPQGYSGPPLDIGLTEGWRGASADEIGAAMHQAQKEQVSKYTLKGKNFWRKAPFLWGEVNVPAAKGVTVGALAQKHGPGVVNQLMPLHGERIMAGGNIFDAVIPSMRPAHTRKIMRSALAHELSDFPKKIRLPSKLRFAEDVPFFSGNYYDPLRKEIRMSNMDPRTVFHEFGHARDLGKPWRRNMVIGSNAAGNALKYLVPASLLMGNSVKKYIPGTIDDRIIEGLQTVGPEAWMASKVLSELHPELRATMHAGKKMKSFSATHPKLMKNTLGKHLMANKIGFASRLPAAVIPYALMAYARKRLKDKKNKNKKEMKKEAGLLPNVGPLIEKIKMLRGNSKYVLEPFNRPTLESLKAMVSGPAATEAFIDYGIPMGVSGLTLAAIKKSQSEAKARAAIEGDEKALKDYHEITGAVTAPVLTAIYKGLKSTASGIGGLITSDSLKEIFE